MAYLLCKKFIEVANLLKSEWRNMLPDSKIYEIPTSLFFNTQIIKMS